MLRSRSLVLSLVLAGFILLSGCRTYGDGKYGTSTKTYEALTKAVESFETDLKGATSDLHRLQEAAAQVDTLRDLVDQYQAVLEEHKSYLEKQRERIDRLSAESTYRNLHNAYGATVTEQRMTQQKYQRVVQRVQTVVQGETEPAAQEAPLRRYTIRPVNFPRKGAEDRLTLEQVLRGL